MDFLNGNGEITAAEAANIIGHSPATARRLLSELVDDGIVVTSGGNRNRQYMSVK